MYGEKHLKLVLSLPVYELTLGNVEGTRSSRVCLPGQRSSRVPSLRQPGIFSLWRTLVSWKLKCMYLKLQVQVIHEPTHFYEQLLNRSVTAKKVEFNPLAQFYIFSDSSELFSPLCTLELGPRKLNWFQGFKATLLPTLI